MRIEHHFESKSGGLFFVSQYYVIFFWVVQESTLFKRKRA
jgi:hypothetical protein